MKAFKGILFDMDGTLISTYEHVNYKKALLELKSVQKSLILKILRSKVKSFADLETKIAEEVEDQQEADLLIQRIRGFLIQHYENVPLKKEARCFLDYLKKEGYQICLCTNNATSIVAHILEQKQLSEYFDYVITSQQVSKAKPDPQMYNKALEYIGLDPQDCLVFEDTESGVLAAKHAGIRVIAICQKDKKKFADCDMVIRDFGDERLYELL